ncbi:MAG: hypothetical protein R2699_10905 [Acidimicrobiales bacterium]
MGACTAVGLTAAGPGMIVMAHRAWMPTFTGALLLAGGVGFVLWAVPSPWSAASPIGPGSVRSGVRSPGCRRRCD